MTPPALTHLSMYTAVFPPSRESNFAVVAPLVKTVRNCSAPGSIGAGDRREYAQVADLKSQRREEVEVDA